MKSMKCQSIVNQNRYTKIGNCEEELPKKPVGRQTADSRPTVGRQSTDRLRKIEQLTLY